MSKLAVPHEVTRQREARAWELRIQGWTHQRIADELNVERSTVTKMLQRLCKSASKKLLDKTVEYKMQQLGLLEIIVDEMMQAWERSKSPEKVVTRRQTEGNAPGDQGGQAADKKTDITQRVADQDGDTGFVSEARAAMADIRKILGIEHPLKLLQMDFTKLTDVQLQALADGQDPFLVLSMENNEE